MYVNIIEYTKVIMYLYHVCLEDHGSNIIFLYWGKLLLEHF